LPLIARFHGWPIGSSDMGTGAKVIFAHDLSTERDRTLLAEYPGLQALRLN